MWVQLGGQCPRIVTGEKDIGVAIEVVGGVVIVVVRGVVGGVV